ncbi:MAG TPA: MFS transporter [Spirochaetia bacterium]|nr:MFS transporter [Spirochaetia bacterium]
MYRELPRSIHVLFFARMVNSMGAFVFPFLTLYLTQKLHLSAATSGSFMLLIAAAHVPGTILGGKLADSIGRKKILLIGQTAAGLFLLPGVFLGNSMLVPWSILVAQFFAALGQPSNQAMAMDLTTKANRQAAFSLLFLGYNLGFAVGPMLAGFMFAHLTWMLFLGDAVTTIVSVALVAALVPDTTPSKEHISESVAVNSGERAEEGHTVRALLARPLLLAFAAIVAILTFVYAQNGFALPLQLNKLFGTQGPVFYGSMMTLNAIIVIVLTAPAVALTRGNRPVTNIMIAALCYAIGFGMIFFIRTYAIFFISVAIWTLGEILISTNSNVYISNHTPISHRGRFNSIFPLITGGGRALSPAVVGWYIRFVGVQLVWPLMAALAALAGLALVVLRTRESERNLSHRS